jgi:hypothetical protein
MAAWSRTCRRVQSPTPKPSGVEAITARQVSDTVFEHESVDEVLDFKAQSYQQSGAPWPAG